MQGVKASSRGSATLFRWIRVLIVLVAPLPICSSHAAAQAIRVRRPAPRPELFVFASLTVTASPTAISFALVSKGAANASTPVAITTSYFLGVSLSGTLTLYGYFLSAGSALSGGSPVSSIPSSDVYGLVPTGTPTSFTAFTQTTPYGGASGLQLYSITSISSLSGSRTDNLSLKIDLTATPQLPAATYTGTLYLEAQSF